RPYLQSDDCIRSDHPVVAAKARELVENLPLADRRDTRKVVWAIYEWVSKHIEHDGVYSEPPGGFNQPYRDVTSGIWQTISGEGWCWGRNFYDWCYRPHELLQTEAGICVEHAWLVCAILRSLNIPARAAVGSLEFWAQDADGRGAWVHLSTTGGRNTFRQRGQLGAGFGGRPPEVRYSVSSRPVLHEDWNAENQGLWRERHPWSERYEATQRGYEQAQADLRRFAATGQAPRGTLNRRPARAPRRPGAGPPRGTRRQQAQDLFDLSVQRTRGPLRPAECYEIHYSDVTIGLLTMGDQRILDVRFPMTTEPPGERLEVETAYWTNHPEWVRRTWVEKITAPPAEGTERWFHIEFDLGKALGGQPSLKKEGA
ncbi:MAG TPA: transglutaminase domain-containing protein, partial [Planctomycetaceae bacterium]|nr:transglutaminase domain-containing protein [Planctomycetaceae bacterium]